jgi:hypothetical protein
VTSISGFYRSRRRGSRHPDKFGDAVVRTRQSAQDVHESVRRRTSRAGISRSFFWTRARMDRCENRRQSPLWRRARISRSACLLAKATMPFNGMTRPHHDSGELFHALGNWYNWKRTEKTHSLEKIMFVAMNRFKVIKEERKTFEDLWVTRESYLEELKSQSGNATLAYGRRYHDCPSGRLGAAGREEARVPFSTSSPPPFMPGHSLARLPRSKERPASKGRVNKGRTRA